MLRTEHSDRHLDFCLSMAESFWSSETIISADGTESVVSKIPRKNSPLEEIVAILTLLIWFGCASYSATHLALGNGSAGGN